MQLVNQTRLPKRVLRPLLAAAARYAKAHTSRVLVRVRWGWGTSSAKETTYWWRINGRMHSGLQGRIDIVLQRKMDALDLAREFWRVGVHEWHHIAWSQDGNDFHHDLPYHEREHEQEASHCEHRAEDNPPAPVQDMILALAEARESLSRKNR